MAPRTPKLVSSLVNVGVLDDAVVAVPAVDEDVADGELEVAGEVDDAGDVEMPDFLSEGFLHEDSDVMNSSFLSKIPFEFIRKFLDEDSNDWYSSFLARILDEAASDCESRIFEADSSD